MYLTHKSHEFIIVTYLCMFLTDKSHKLIYISQYLLVKAMI